MVRQKFQKGNEYGKLNKGRSRPDLLQSNIANNPMSNPEVRAKASETKRARYASGETVSWCKGKRFHRVSRPDHPCPKCGSVFVRSTGKSWHCSDCDKIWQKNPIGKKVRFVDRKDNPCPYCGSTHVVSNALNWKCGDCGKSWVKNKIRNKITKEMLEELKGKSQYEIAEKLGCSQANVSLLLKKFGLEPNSKSLGVYRRSEEDKKRIYAKVSNSMKGNTNWRFSHEFPNKEEKKLIIYFKKWSFPFEYVGDGSFKIGGKCPDFVWKDKKAVVEFYGELWHDSEDEGKRSDFFKSHGWNCLVIWGKEVGWWSLKRQHITYKWEVILYKKISKWLQSL